MSADPHIQQIELQGYTLLPAVLSGEELDEARTELQRVVADERGQPGYPADSYGAWAYNLMNKARIFEQVYQRLALLDVVRHFLGPDAQLSGVMGRVVLPGAPSQSLHCDGSLTGPFRAGAAADDGRRCVSHVFGLNVIWCLTDFTGPGGATRLVPGSHRLATREIYNRGNPPGQLAIEAPAGSVLVFNIALWHGASAHQGDHPRLALITPWRRSWVRPEVDLSRMVHPDVLERAGPAGAAVFGLTSRPPYTERWQWDPSSGRPKPEWSHLEKDDPRT